MSREDSDKKSFIRPNMTILDVISKDRRTEAVFKQYDQRTGVCLCCQALFDPLKAVADHYGLDLTELMSDLNAVTEGEK